MRDKIQHSVELARNDGPYWHLCGMNNVLARIGSFKVLAREFYYDVVIGGYRCPECCGKLHMIEQYRAACEVCKKVLDPTVMFQESLCCKAHLMRRQLHYVCSHCHQIVPSRFLFDERLYDKAYFQEMMKKSRARSLKVREEAINKLKASLSGSFYLTEDPVIEGVPGLMEALNLFLTQKESFQCGQGLLGKYEFAMPAYRQHILQSLGWGRHSFSSFLPMGNESRKDRVWRFITLVYMDHTGEVVLTQEDHDIWVARGNREAYQQG